MSTVALYARVSTDRQSKGLEAQIRTLREYCKANGIDSSQIYSDTNISGSKQSRPALDQLMKDCKDGKVQSVVVYSFSRFARSTKHLLSALDLFKTLNINFISLTESLDTRTPVGTAIFTIISAIGQLERELISERVKNGLANAKAKGKRIGRPKTRNSTLILELHKQGLSLRKIAHLAKCSQWSVWQEVKDS